MIKTVPLSGHCETEAIKTVSLPGHCKTEVIKAVSLFGHRKTGATRTGVFRLQKERIRNGT